MVVVHVSSVKLRLTFSIIQQEDGLHFSGSLLKLFRHELQTYSLSSMLQYRVTVCSNQSVVNKCEPTGFIFDSEALQWCHGIYTNHFHNIEHPPLIPWGVFLWPAGALNSAQGAAPLWSPSFSARLPPHPSDLLSVSLQSVHPAVGGCTAACQSLLDCGPGTSKQTLTWLEMLLWVEDCITNTLGSPRAL